MKNFVTWVKPNGIIIIKIPDPYSVRGFVTRNTPFWFHVLYYRIFHRTKKGALALSAHTTMQSLLERVHMIFASRKITKLHVLLSMATDALVPQIIALPGSS